MYPKLASFHLLLLFYYLLIVIIFAAFRLPPPFLCFFYLFGRRRETSALRACFFLSFGMSLDSQKILELKIFHFRGVEGGPR